MDASPEGGIVKRTFRTPLKSRTAALPGSARERRWSSGFRLGRVTVVVKRGHSQTLATGLLSPHECRLIPQYRRQTEPRTALATPSRAGVSLIEMLVVMTVAAVMVGIAVTTIHLL